MMNKKQEERAYDYLYGYKVRKNIIVNAVTIKSRDKKALRKIYIIITKKIPLVNFLKKLTKKIRYPMFSFSSSSKEEGLFQYALLSFYGLIYLYIIIFVFYKLFIEINIVDIVSYIIQTSSSYLIEYIGFVFNRKINGLEIVTDFINNTIFSYIADIRENYFVYLTQFMKEIFFLGNHFIKISDYVFNIFLYNSVVQYFLEIKMLVHLNYFAKCIISGLIMFILNVSFNFRERLEKLIQLFVKIWYHNRLPGGSKFRKYPQYKPQQKWRSGRLFRYWRKRLFFSKKYEFQFWKEKLYDGKNWTFYNKNEFFGQMNWKKKKINNTWLSFYANPNLQFSNLQEEYYKKVKTFSSNKILDMHHWDPVIETIAQILRPYNNFLDENYSKKNVLKENKPYFRHTFYLWKRIRYKFWTPEGLEKFKIYRFTPNFFYEVGHPIARYEDIKKAKVLHFKDGTKRRFILNYPTNPKYNTYVSPGGFLNQFNHDNMTVLNDAKYTALQNILCVQNPQYGKDLALNAFFSTNPDGKKIAAEIAVLCEYWSNEHEVKSLPTSNKYKPRESRRRIPIFYNTTPSRKWDFIIEYQKNLKKANNNS